MGEGWSDWLAIALTALPTESGPAPRGIGTYALYTHDRTAKGIRPTAYSTDMAINPATYDTIKTAAVPHGVGYVWATMLNEVLWDLVGAYGFNPDVYGPWSSGGNNLAIQLVMDGMKMQPCSPGFVDGRDAILAADLALTGGRNRCLVWRGFAKRGLGLSAQQGASSNRADGTQAFDLPASCLAEIAVQPGSLSAVVGEGQRHTAELAIANVATGGADLAWDVTEAATDCAAPADLPWLSAAPASGTTASGASSALSVVLDASAVPAGSSRQGVLCVASNDSDTPVVAVPVSMAVRFPFDGFYGTLKQPGINDVRAGSTVPVSFSLSGNRGLGIFAPGSPSSQRIDCATAAPIGSPVPTSTSRNGSLTYDATTDRYHYPWQTASSWAGTCRVLTVALVDGSEHTAAFRFGK
jgi:hypothetical protein